MDFWDIARLVGTMVVAVFCGVAVWLQVPPLPSRRQELDRAFGLAAIMPGEVVFDLGAGDGRVLQRARDQFGAKVQGWELHPIMWLLAVGRLGWSNVSLSDLWKAPVDQADVVFVFLMQSLMGRVEREIWSRMKPGARLVSNSFVMAGVAPTRVDGEVFVYEKPAIG